MFAFVLHCAGTPLNIKVNFWVFECNAPFHRRPSATPYQRIYSDVNRQKIVFNISLSLLDCCNKKTITFKFQRYAPDSPAWQLHLHQLYQLGRRIRAESRQLHQLSSSICANTTLASRGLILVSFQVSRDAGRQRYYAVAAPVAPHHSGDPSPSAAQSPFQRCLQFDTRNYLQSPCRSEASPKLGARFIDAWRSLSQRARQSVFSECSDYMYAGMR